MSLLRNVARTSLALLFLFLASCLDYREELWLESNGSGKLHSTITVHSEIGFAGNPEEGTDQVEAQLQTLFDATEGITVEHFEKQYQGKQRVYDFTIAFQDIKQLRPTTISGQGNLGALFGEIEIKTGPEGRLVFGRTVQLTPDETPSQGEDRPSASEADDPAPSLADQIAEAIGERVTDAALDDFHLEYITHFPTEVIEANAPGIDRETNMVSWKIPLAEAIRAPFAMEAQIKRPGTWMLWFFGALVILVTGAILIPALRKKA